MPRGFLEGEGRVSVFQRPVLPITIIKMVTIIELVAEAPCVLIKQLRSDDAQMHGHFRSCFPQKVQELVALQLPGPLTHWENKVNKPHHGTVKWLLKIVLLFKT